MRSAITPTVRNGTRDVDAARVEMVDMGIHLSGMRQAGRRRVRAVRARTSPSRCSGSPVGAVSASQAVEGAVEIVARRHAGRLSVWVEGRVSASSAARIAWVARWSRDRTVPGGMPSASATSSRESPR